MITIEVPETEYFDEEKNAFVYTPATELHLEHSLISLSRWESKWKKPYLSKEGHTREELLDYIGCMSMNSKPIDPLVIRNISADDLDKIIKYIGDPYTATKIYDRRPNKGSSNEVYTSEILYYWMIYYNIPVEFEKWHLNRLLTLIKVCGIKGGTNNQQMDMNAIFAQNRKLNAARRGKH